MWRILLPSSETPGGEKRVLKVDIAESRNGKVGVKKGLNSSTGMRVKRMGTRLPSLHHGVKKSDRRRLIVLI